MYELRNKWKNKPETTGIPAASGIFQTVQHVSGTILTDLRDRVPVHQ